jgi:TolA-binding protein
MASLQDRRVWIGGGGVVALLLAAASWFLFIHPQFSSAADLRSQTADQQLQNVQTQNTVNQLKAKSQHLNRYIAQLEHALESLPTDSGLPAFTRQVTAQAKANQVDLTSITVGAVVAANGSPAATATTPDSTDGTTTTAPTPTPTPTPTATATDGTTPAAPVAPAGAAAGQIYAIPVTVVSDGSLVQQTKFLEAIRAAGPRYGLVSSVQFAPAAGSTAQSIDGGNTMTVQVTVFSAPQSPPQVAELHKLLSGDIGN